MKGYIALSRVTKAQDLYLPQPFSPALFNQREQPWPTLLLDCLRTNQPPEDLATHRADQEESKRDENPSDNDVALRLLYCSWQERTTLRCLPH